MPKEHPGLSPLRRINLLYRDCILVLEREVRHLKEASIAGKLPGTMGTHLIHYIKLLAELKKAQEVIEAEKAEAVAAASKKLSERELIETTVNVKSKD